MGKRKSEVGHLSKEQYQAWETREEKKGARMEMGSFQRAPADVLAKRKIIRRAKRPGKAAPAPQPSTSTALSGVFGGNGAAAAKPAGNALSAFVGASAATKSNPFAGVSLLSGVSPKATTKPALDTGAQKTNPFAGVSLTAKSIPAALQVAKPLSVVAASSAAGSSGFGGFGFGTGGSATSSFSSSSSSSSLPLSSSSSSSPALGSGPSSVAIDALVAEAASLNTAFQKWVAAQLADPSRSASTWRDGVQDYISFASAIQRRLDAEGDKGKKKNESKKPPSSSSSSSSFSSSSAAAPLAQAAAGFTAPASTTPALTFSAAPPPLKAASGVFPGLPKAPATAVSASAAPPPPPAAAAKDVDAFGTKKRDKKGDKVEKADLGDEVAIFESRCKAFRWNQEGKEWKEVGVCGLSLLAKKGTHADAHLVLRDETTGRPRLNTRLYKGIKIEKSGKRGVTVLAMTAGKDGKDGGAEMTKWLLRLKNGVVADEAREKMLAAAPGGGGVEAPSQSSQPTSSSSSSFSSSSSSSSATAAAPAAAAAAASAIAPAPAKNAPFTFGAAPAVALAAPAASSSAPAFAGFGGFGAPAPAPAASTTASGFSFGFSAKPTAFGGTTSAAAAAAAVPTPTAAANSAVAAPSSSSSSSSSSNDTDAFGTKKKKSSGKVEKGDLGDEEVLYETRTKAHKWDQGNEEWKEVGVLGLSILAKKGTHADAHLVLRDETTGRPRLNTRLYKGIKIEKSGKRGVTVLAVTAGKDGKDGEAGGAKMSKWRLSLKNGAKAEEAKAAMLGAADK